MFNSNLGRAQRDFGNHWSNRMSQIAHTPSLEKGILQVANARYLFSILSDVSV